MRQAERVLLVLGLLLLGIFLAAYLDRQISSRAQISRYRDLERTAAMSSDAAARFNTDFALWSEQRLAAWKTSLTQSVDVPLGILRVPKVKLEVPILEGTSELVLNRGVGHVAGTELPGKPGNIGIAGHRDGFFRALKDVAVGDLIELETQNGTDVYKVDTVIIVDPSDISALAPRATPSLTLITCYPFYFVGSAPKRYILQAGMLSSAPVRTTAQHRLPSNFASPDETLAQNRKSPSRR